MKIADLGGEFALIRRLTGKSVIPEGLEDRLVKGVGDDCAVLRMTGATAGSGTRVENGTGAGTGIPAGIVLDQGGRLMLVTTDMLVDGDHFNRDWASPEQVGGKAMEANVSDIAAMGGRPLFAFVSLALTNDISVEFMNGLYDGMHESCARHGFMIAGGDTTHGSTFVINVAIVGEVPGNRLCLRGDARADDLICVTGDLGKSWAGLELFMAGRPEEGNVKPFLEPVCRLDVSDIIAPHANAMIDVSDGLAPEVRHICEESGCGAVIHREEIPMAEHTLGTAALLGKDPYRWALSGGEDFELVFTIPPSKIDSLRGKVDFTIVGKILPEGEGIWLQDGELRVPLPGGYDHFSSK